MREILTDNESGWLAFFFCQNNQANANRDDSFLGSGPEEVLRSILSQLSTSEKTKSAATIVKEKQVDFRPPSDKRRTLNYENCTEKTVSLTNEMLILIILSAYDELDRNKSLVLQKCLEEIVN